MTGLAPKFCVTVPVRNESERLEVLLGALADQTNQTRTKVIVSINNSDDGSREVAERCRAEMRRRLDIFVDVVHFESHLAHAGSARRRAMDLGADLVGERGIIITTDADARPPSTWIAENLQALSLGLDVVGGRIMLDQKERVSPAVLIARAAEDRYWQQVRAIEDAIDPVSWDPPPRHGDHTGGSLAITAACYLKAGRVPIIASGEDRTLVQNAVRNGGKLAHPDAIWTRVSPRVAGRAAFGMADHMAMVQAAINGRKPIRVPAFAHWEERALWRKSLRARGGASLVAEREPDLADMPLDMQLCVEGLTDCIGGERV